MVRVGEWRESCSAGVTSDCAWLRGSGSPCPSRMRPLRPSLRGSIRTRPMRAILGFAVILASAALLVAGRPTGAETRASLAGQFLVASPSMGDPRFDRAVILMVRHRPDGALGIVINKPLGERPLANLLEVFGEKGSNAGGQIRIFAGGPVQRELGFVVHTADYRRSGTLEVDGRVAMTSSREILRDI